MLLLYFFHYFHERHSPRKEFSLCSFAVHTRLNGWEDFQSSQSCKQDVLYETDFLKVMAIEGVTAFSEPHFWKHSKDLIVGTLHIQLKEDADEEKVRMEAAKIFKKKGVKNMTIEMHR
jgi:hypothetical protein